MYKNFNLTDEERKQIMEMHESHGYKKPVEDVDETIFERLALRKLTLKSKWDFSPKHQGILIQDVLNFNPKSVLWAYLNLEKISFNDEVLSILKGIYPSLELIEKPGIDKEQFAIIDDESNPWAKYTYPELKKIVAAKKINKENISKGLLSTMDRKKRFYKKEKHDADLLSTNVDSKEKMQGANHGNLWLRGN
jgi:ssDNA-binding Zn-finger/Zn-ribbon topoisomerase 1